MIYKKAKKKEEEEAVLSMELFTGPVAPGFSALVHGSTQQQGPNPPVLLSGPWRPRAASRRRRGGAEAREMAAPGTTRRRGKRRRSLPAGSSIRDSSPPSCRRTGSTSSRCPSCTAFLRTFDLGPLLLLSPHMGMVVLDFSFRRVRRCQ